MGAEQEIVPEGRAAATDPQDESTIKHGGGAQTPVSSGAPIQAGSRIDHYELLEPLGRGGMGEVWAARDVRLGRLVALKFLRGALASHVRRFISEARTTAHLTHENIVSLHDVGEHRGTLYMVLEYVRGQSLREWLTARLAATDASAAASAVSLREVVELMVPVVRALVHAHEAGVVHRDLKLANVMLTESGAVKVLDFGIAKLVGGARRAFGSAIADDYSSITGAQNVVGTLSYMSPEQMRSAPADPRMDLWAVGIMLHILAVGRHPLGGVGKSPSVEDLVGVRDLTVPMPSAREQHPELGKLATIIDRCLIKSKEDRLGSARELLAELEALLPNRARRRDDDNPYPGLVAFQEGDADRFFGRERVVAQALARLAERPLLAVIGPSGAGKSSFVRAGLLPALKRGDDAWQGLVLRPGPRPLIALAEMLLRHRSDGSSDSGHATNDGSLSGHTAREALCQRLQAEPAHLGDVLRARAQRGRVRIVLFCDQLEEAFTLADAGERATFFACLCGAAADALSPLRVVVSMRSDFLDRLTEAPALAEIVGPAVFLLGPMTRDELKMALLEPARQVDHQFESEAMVTEMLDALGGTAGALPLLQFTAARLWDSRDRERRMLTEESYRRMGGVAGALASHADAVLESLSSKEKRAARAVLLRLVTPERTRALVPLRELGDLFSATGADIEHVVARLVDARLVSIETGDEGEDKIVEIVHESLLERWGRLRGWLDEEQHDAQFLAELRSAAAQWEKNGHAEGFLWRDEAARRAQSWRGQRRAAGRTEIARRELGYLEAVIALAERMKKRRRRIVTGMFSVTVLIAVVVSLLAIDARAQARSAHQEMERADEQAKQAQEEARRARNATRVTAAAVEIQSDPTTALSLLREIEPGSVPPGWASLALWARGASVAQLVIHHDDEVTSAAYSPDGRRIVCGSRDHTVRISNADGQGEPLVLRGHADRVTSVAFSPDGRRVVSASSDKTVRVWNADGQGEPLVLRGHADRVASVAFSPDGQHIVSASYDRSVLAWDAGGRGAPLVVGRHDGAVQSVAYSFDGRRIVSASQDKTVRVWDAGGRGEAVVLEGHGGGVLSAAFSPDGRRIVSASQDKTVRVWDAGGRGEAVVLEGHQNYVWSVAFSPDGRRVASGSWDKTVRLWDAAGQDDPEILRAHGSYVFSVAFSPDGRHLLSGAADRTLRTWDVGEKGQILTFRGHESPVYGIAYSPDGQRIASASGDRTVRVWSADGKGAPVVLRGHEGEVNSAVFSPDGTRLASASLDKTVRVWSADGKGAPVVLRGHGATVDSAAFSPDGRRIVSASWDKTVRVWSADGKGEPLVLRGHDDRVYWAAFSPDGRRIVSASEDRTVRVWDADGKGEPIVLRGHEGPVVSAAFSPDGRRVASTSETTLRLWRADGDGEPLVLRSHEALAFVRSDRPFSPDGRRIVSSSNDGTVRIWNTDGTGEPIVFHGTGAPINAASWSPDGRRIVAASEDRTILLWRDIEPFSAAGDPRLWSATRYCMPLPIRRRMLGFSEQQMRTDLEHCQSRVAEASRAQL